MRRQFVNDLGAPGSVDAVRGALVEFLVVLAGTVTVIGVDDRALMPTPLINQMGKVFIDLRALLEDHEPQGKLSGQRRD